MASGSSHIVVDSTVTANVGCGSGISDQDYSEQLDEITALEAIYEADVFNVTSRCQNGTGFFTAEFTIPVHIGDAGVMVELWLPNEAENNGNTNEDDHEESGSYEPGPSALGKQRPNVCRSESGQRRYMGTKVHNLPPLTLNVTLPFSYPSSEKPSFTLSCVWLKKTQLSRLCEQLDQLWMEGMPVLFTWVDWLQNESFNHLELDGTVALAPQSLQQDDVMHDIDSRVFHTDMEMEECLAEIMSNEHQQKVNKFMQLQHECEVCFDVKLGTEFFLSPDCGHALCLVCLEGFCKVHVQEGTVLQLACPMDGCKADLPHYIIRSLLKDEELERWERLLAERVLESMQDVLWCPRCNKPVIKEAEEKLHLAVCPHCNFCFCTECMEAWHAGRCPTWAELEEEEKKKQDPKTKRSAMQNKKRQHVNKLTSHKSVLFIRQATVPCPKCQAPIEKAGGCNVVICSKCSTVFCYRCGQSFNAHKNCTPYTPSKQMSVVKEEIRNIRKTVNNLKMLSVCPRCKHRNEKEDRNNHIRCWQCMSNYCFLCRAPLPSKQPLSEHFNSASKCVQHSD